MAAIIDKLKKNKPLAQGSKLPTGHKIKEDNPEQGTIDLATLAGKNIIVGVPGAFTPPCSSQVPGYVEKADQFAAKGVQGIYIVAVNDVFTTKAWKEHHKWNHPMVHILADDTGNFTHEAGMSFDASGLLGNHRSSRYAAIVENGSVKAIFIEDEAPSVTTTAAENVLQAV
ncbi:Peroxisomal membrane associated protein 20 [Pseudocercospora fuligena]|uniref:Peroxisomal membrane associated protein 20 n=1 Tax=Pseudocercospora fuligena TaxID=685502 RepID=A0A8H6RQ98_9PEZI|nr:Peroxisomal membrane associated protein 20 [Pseudocercospora fuligena]